MSSLLPANAPPRSQRISRTSSVGPIRRRKARVYSNDEPMAAAHRCVSRDRRLAPSAPAAL
eukprot:3700919-Pyramimonas_sp.AAC.1